MKPMLPFKAARNLETNNCATMPTEVLVTITRIRVNTSGGDRAAREERGPKTKGTAEKPEPKRNQIEPKPETQRVSDLSQNGYGMIIINIIKVMTFCVFNPLIIISNIIRIGPFQVKMQ